jgi:predicted PurR-regulated permease PerM
MTTPRPRWPTQTRFVVSLLMLALFIYLLFRFSVVVPPLILSFILAYILSPVVNRLQERLHVKRGLATALAYLIMLLIATIVPLSIAPLLASQYADLNFDIQLILGQVKALLGQQFTIMGIAIDGGVLVDQISNSFRLLAEPFIGQTLFFLVDVITSFIWVIFILVFSFYLIKDGDALGKSVEGLVPPDYRQDYVRLRDEISLIWGSFFRGQLVLALVVAVIFTVAGFILGIPFSLAMGILAGLLEFLPSLGHAIWLAIAAILAIFVGSTWLPLPNWAFMLLIIALHTAFTQFDLNYLIPRIIGRRVHLQPMVVILGIVVGALTAGVLGIPLAAPTIASARVVGRYIYANLFDLDPFPTEAAQSPSQNTGE